MKEPKLNLTPELVKLIAEIDEFKGRWRALENVSPERLSALRQAAAIESVGSSARIEGAGLSNAQVATLLAGRECGSCSSPEEQEVAGGAQAMELVVEAFADLRLTGDNIRRLHDALLNHADRAEDRRGVCKTFDNHRPAADPDGNDIGRVFETTAPLEAPCEMEELLAWTTRAVDEEALHPLLIVGVFVVVFLAVHPFQDGNGRLSRILTLLLLLRAGYGYAPYVSLESVIEEDKDLYYKALRRTQTTLKSDRPDWNPWIGFFLRRLKKQKDALARWLDQESERGGDADLPGLSVQILTLLKANERQTSAQIADGTGANRNTIKVRLRELVDAGRIKRYGKARATWYAL